MLFGDDLVDNSGGKNAVRQLIEVYERTKSPVVLLERVKKENIHKYGIVGFESSDEFSGRITKVVEKPQPKDAPSDLGIVGKFILTPEVFGLLESTAPDPDAEIRLSSTLSKFIQNGGKLFGKILEGVRFDTGDKLGFLQATLHYALKKEKDSVREALLSDLLQ